MLGRIKRYIIEKTGKHYKNSFFEFLKKKNSFFRFENKNRVNLTVISFSGSKFFFDQLLSLSSFYVNVGIPIEWIIYNDGTYTEQEKSILIKFPNLHIKDFLFSSYDDENLKEFAQKLPTLKKIFIYEQTIIRTTTILVDSDVLFFPVFREFLPFIVQGNWYLVDEGNGYFDEDYIIQKNIAPLNLGMLVLNQAPQWTVVKNYILEKIRIGKLGYWSDQTACHIMATEADHFYPLPKEYFVVGGNDAFEFKHCVDYNRIAVRHFVGPIRHKMWQYPWKKVLQLKS